ncbi:hypothetical protein [Prosthecobacter sp.]|uniref:hypothetical protein n=1 Tax=Prosthecobacter sp. TaxID=1965333 RepID=UPI002AB8E558|nr:hypothetical protein [Prosthecobacter sp.]MDZ4404958.1 hypothetical protein [Prosthecobacter sp.]
MPYDPALPANNSPLVSAEMRAQLNGLKDLINAIQTITAAQVDAVSTGNPGDPAVVTLNVDASTLRFTFIIPRGPEGPAGQAGQDGASGAGVTGAVVDSVMTGNPGDPASVSASFDGSLVRFNFSLPQGLQGPPGEVTSMQLSTAINGTSSNSNAVSTLALAVNDPPTQAEAQSIAHKLDELILALRR